MDELEAEAIVSEAARVGAAVTILATPASFGAGTPVVLHGPENIIPLPPVKPRRTKVAIIGFASSSRDQAPYGDESFEIWGLNHAYSFMPRWDRWFEIHPHSHFQKDLMRDGAAQDGKRHVEWLAKEPAGGRPIYCQDHYDDIPASLRWPREELNAWFRKGGSHTGPDLPSGYYADDYWTSTPAQMLGLAIMEGFEEIHLYGIDMLQKEEYFYQRSGVEARLEFARGRGIKVYVPHESALCKANYVYGFSEPPTDIPSVQGFVDFVTGKVVEMQGNKNNAWGAAQTIDGARQMGQLLLDLLRDGAPVKDEKGEVIKFIGEDGQPVKVKGLDGKETDKPVTRTATLEDVVAMVKEQLRVCGVNHRKALDAMVGIDGQLAGFQCCISWIEHHARGGTLK